jgi:uncharacterized membrane protein (UPF0127 family)
VIASLLLLVACGGSTKHPVVELTVGGHPVQAEHVFTQEARAYGLMKRDSLPEDHGMLFTYPDTKVRGFWMKDTWIPLSIAFTDADGTIVKIADMEPHDTTRTSSLYPAMHALEMTKGWFDEHGVKKGDRIEGIPQVEAEP